MNMMFHLLMTKNLVDECHAEPHLIAICYITLFLKKKWQFWPLILLLPITIVICRNDVHSINLLERSYSFLSNDVQQFLC